MEPSGTETLDSWILEKFKDFAHHSQQEKKKIYLGHIILSRAAHAASEIRNRMNPLWKIADIPSGKSVTDMLRAIRFHLFKISQYKLAIEAMKKKVEYKNKLWDEEDKLDYIRNDVKERYEKFLAEFTFPDFWLAFLVCSYPVDHYLQQKKSLPLVVPPMDANLQFDPAVTSTKPTRKAERDRASQVPGTASAGRKRSRDDSAGEDEGSSEVTTIHMNHTIRTASSKTDSAIAGEDESIAGLQAQIATIRTLISNLEELGALEFAFEIRQYKLSVVSLCKEILELQVLKSRNLKRSRAAMLQSSSAIVQGVLRGSDLSSLSASSGGNTSLTQATVPFLPSPSSSLFASPLPPPADQRSNSSKYKSMNVTHFDKRMEETYGPVSTNTSNM